MLLKISHTADQDLNQIVQPKLSCIIFCKDMARPARSSQNFGPLVVDSGSRCLCQLRLQRLTMRGGSHTINIQKRKPIIYHCSHFVDLMSWLEATYGQRSCFIRTARRESACGIGFGVSSLFCTCMRHA